MKGEAYRESSLGGGEKKKKSCMYGEEGQGRRGRGGGVEGFSGAVQARSAKICLMHSLNLGPARASLKVTGEACAERSRGKKPCSRSSSPHATRFVMDSGLCRFDKCFIFRGVLL